MRLGQGENERMGVGLGHTCPGLPTMHCWGVGLGLGFGLENKERSKEDQRHY